MRDTNNGMKYITKLDLVRCLNDVQDSARIYVNPITCNLTVTDEQCNDLGYVDFAEEGTFEEL